MIAAILSQDPEMLSVYATGDPYLAFAKRAKAIPPEATKELHDAIRDLFKQCVLGVQYGMGADKLALRIGKSAPYAKELLRPHKQIYPKYWEWCDHVLNTFFLFKRISTCYDWQMHVIGNAKKDAGTITNFPCQATGAEILRMTSFL